MSSAYIRKMMRLCLLLPLLLVGGCMEDLFKSPFAIQFPQNNGVYVGDQLIDFVVTYDKPVSRADIFINGVQIGDVFSYGPTSANANVQNFRRYLREGKNVLTVDPMAFGPTVTFTVDTKGPDIIIDWGYNAAGFTTVGGALRDATSPSSLKLDIVRIVDIDSATGAVTREIAATYNLDLDANNRFYRENIDVSSGVTIYSFTATDVHGYVSTKEYLADSNDISAMSISNAMRMAIGDSFVESLRPIIASGLYSSLQEVPIDIRDLCWNDPNKSGPPSQNPNGGFCATGQDGSTFNPGLNPISVDIGLGAMPTTIRRVFMDEGATALLNRFKVEANNRLDIELIITEMTVSLRIDGGWLLGNIDMTMTIGRIVADTGADVSAVNKRVTVELVDSDFVLEDITVSETKIWGMELGGLVNAIIPILEGIIADLLPGIINPILNDNLQKIVIGAKVLSQEDLNKEYFEYALNVETIKTDNLFGPGNPYDMIVGLETRFNLLEADPLARPTLGPVYIEDPVDVGLIYNSTGETGTNLSFALSSNALNQAFASMYASGLSHFSIVNGEVTYGADPSLPAGTNGQTRVRLYPQSPPYFTLRPVDGAVGGAASASIGYESAVMYLDEHKSGAWRNQVRLEVEANIAAKLDQVDNAVKITIDGSPVFTIHDMVNNTGFPVTKGMLQGMMDMLNMYFFPQLSENFITIDLAELADSGLNGTQVLFQSDRDDRTQTLGPQGCPLASDTAGDDGNYDYVCHTININFNTSAVTSTGEKGTNLFFQMEARDPNIPAAPAIPRFDFDDDGVFDYRDNCSVPTLVLLEAINAAGGLAGNVDAEGNPIGTFADDVAAYINEQLATEHGGSPAAVPSAGDISWWNTMRKGDDPITDLGSFPWITMLYSNAGQRNTDGDRIGELCEDDTDRDGLYVDNGPNPDTCPQVYDPSNDAGKCTIDLAEYVLFKNKFTGQCMTHYSFTDDTDTGTFNPADWGSTAQAKFLGWAACNVNDLAQRFYVEVAAADETHENRFAFQERIIHIYTNEWKQIDPGFYDTVNHHYLAATIANMQAGSSSWFNYDDVIVTTMAGYDGNWRQWLLSASGIDGYPYLIESMRVWDVYGKPGGFTPGRRDCIFHKDGVARPDADNGSCFVSDEVSRERAAFQVLLGPEQVPWQGRFEQD